MTRIFTPLILTLIFFCGTTITRADTVILKDGTKHEGKITLKTPDLIKIQISKTDKIKETKTIPIGEVAEIVETAPDDVLFAKIQHLTPTGSMVSSEQYKTMLNSANDFLNRFSGSKHKPKVDQIKATLEEELDKVERGHFKLEGTWYSPQDQIDYETLIKSKVALSRMKSTIGGGQYLNLIGAMRHFETLEEQYFGSPAFADAVGLALNILPSLRRQLQGLRRDVDVKMAKWEADKNALDEQLRLRIEAAREREKQTLAAALAADKKAGIKWTRVDTTSSQHLDSYIQQVAEEINRLKVYDLAGLKKQSEALVAVDQMIIAGNLDKASSELKLATSIPVSVTGKSSRSGRGSSSYSSAISAKLKSRLADRKAAAKAAEEAKKSEALTAKLLASKGTPKTSPETTTTDPEGTGTTPPGGDEDTPATKEKSGEDENFDAFAALATASASKKKPEEKKPVVKKKKKPTSKKASSSSSRERPPPPPPERRISFQMIVIGLTVLLIAGIVIMKVLGIGGKKE